MRKNLKANMIEEFTSIKGDQGPFSLQSIFTANIMNLRADHADVNSELKVIAILIAIITEEFRIQTEFMAETICDWRDISFLICHYVLMVERIDVTIRPLYYFFISFTLLNHSDKNYFVIEVRIDLN